MKRMKMRILLFILICGVTAFAGIDDVFSSMQNAFSRGVDPELMLGIALGALFLIGLLVLNEIRKAEARERARAKISWDAFYAKTLELALSKEEITLLESKAVLLQ